MNSLKNSFVILAILLMAMACKKESKRQANGLTAINPLAYTDVAFMGSKDTAVVSTYSGRIIRKIKDQPEGQVLANIEDEIYALKYAQSRNELIAATHQSGILILDAETGKINRELELEKWCVSLFLSEDENCLN